MPSNPIALKKQIYSHAGKPYFNKSYPIIDENGVLYFIIESGYLFA
jgi:hypothetical protein